MTTRLMLASGSPRRRALLTLTGLPFEVARPDIDETPQPGEPAAQYVARLSREKSLAVHAADALIVTADTTVADGTDILGKPADATEARAMLARLRGRAHIVHTGVTVCDTKRGTESTQVVTSTVLMRAYSDDEMARYIARGEPFDKAGSYAIHDLEFRPVARLTGCYANVMGLPMCTLCRMLAEHGVSVPVPPTCNPSTESCDYEPK